MGLLRNMLANVVICGFLLRLFNYFQLGIEITINPTLTASVFHLIAIFAVLGLVFRLLNSPIKWIIQTLSFPVNMLTLGLFSLVINVAIFYLFARIMNTYFSDLGVIGEDAIQRVVQLGNLLQTLILSFIMAVGIAVLRKVI